MIRRCARLASGPGHPGVDGGDAVGEVPDRPASMSGFRRRARVERRGSGPVASESNRANGEPTRGPRCW
jgi:hypothetical protein